MGGSTFRATHIKSTAVLHRQPLKERHQGPFGTSSNLFGASFSFPRERKQENLWLKCSLLEPPPAKVQAYRSRRGAATAVGG